MSTSIGYSSAINGSNVGMYNFVRRPQNPGGAICGWMPQTILLVDKRYNEYETVRYTLNNSWNNSYQDQLSRNNISTPIVTPFRAVNNAGDLLSRQNYSCGGGCQTPQSRPGLNGLSQRFGSNQGSCVPSAVYSNLQMLDNIPAAACNPKYVYDSSDYIRYLKQAAQKKNYNDLAYGGNDYSTSQSKIRSSKRY